MAASAAFPVASGREVSMTRATIFAVLAALALTPTLGGLAEAGPDEARKAVLVLSETIVSFDFKERPLPEVLSFFTQVSGVTFLVSPLLAQEMSPEELAVTLRLDRASLKTALRIILDLKGIAAVWRYGTILVTTPKDARGKPILRLYPIGDLTVRIRDFPAPELMLRPAGAEDYGQVGGVVEEGQERAFADPEFLQDLVTQNTGAGTWEDEGVSVSANDRFLIVRQYATVHVEIERLLSLLRSFQ
jgi:hypothetical protein